MLVVDIGFFISAIIAIINIAFYILIIALGTKIMTDTAKTRVYIDVAIYAVGQIGYFIVVLLLSEDAKLWFMNNLGLTADESCPEEAQECPEEPTECEEDQEEECTYEADLALYEACVEFNAARDECIAAAAAAAAEALAAECETCEGDACPEECPEGDAEEDEEEAFFF